MKRVIIYSVDYFGHIIECLGIAECIRQSGYEVIFAFNLFPSKEIYELITSKNIKIDVSCSYTKIAVQDKSEEVLLSALIDSIAQTLLYYQPDLVLCDNVQLVPIICRKLNIKTAVVTRTNIPPTFNHELFIIINNILIKKGIIAKNETWKLQELLMGDVQVIPHSKFFMKIDVKNPYYYRSKNIKVKDMSSKCTPSFDIICVMSTAYDMGNCVNRLVEAFKETKYKVLICYPQAKECQIIHRICIEKWVNLDTLIKDSKFVISTGGHGIVTKAIIDKKIQIVLEVNEIFSIYYGERIEAHKLGKFLNLQDLNNKRLLEIIDSLYENEAYQFRVNFMSNDFLKMENFNIENVLECLQI